MIALIARTSRSYAVGLKNSDIEIAWAHQYCRKAANQSVNNMEALTQCKFNLMIFSIQIFNFRS